MMQQVTKSLKKGISRRTTILITLLCLLVVSSYANYRLGLDQAAIQTDLPVVRVQGAPPASSPTP